MLTQAEARGIYGEGYAWITSDATTATGAVAAATSGDVTNARRLLSGLLNFYVSPHVTAGFARFTQAWEVWHRPDSHPCNALMTCDGGPARASRKACSPMRI